MLYDAKQPYTPPPEPYKLNQHALAVDGETVGAGPTVEIIEIALEDTDHLILYFSAKPKI